MGEESLQLLPPWNQARRSSNPSETAAWLCLTSYNSIFITVIIATITTTITTSSVTIFHYHQQPSLTSLLATTIQHQSFTITNHSPPPPSTTNHHHYPPWTHVPPSNLTIPTSPSAGAHPQGFFEAAPEAQDLRAPEEGASTWAGTCLGVGWLGELLGVGELLGLLGLMMVDDGYYGWWWLQWLLGLLGLLWLL